MQTHCLITSQRLRSLIYCRPASHRISLPRWLDFLKTVNVPVYVMFDKFQYNVLLSDMKL